MRIAHICPSIFTDGLTYQENILVSQNVEDGHEVIVIASTEAIDKHTHSVQTQAGKSLTIDGVPLIRLPYKKFLPIRISRKVRALQGLMKTLNSFQPDVILFHGAQSWEILNLRKYANQNSKVKCYADCHSDKYNSGRTWISKQFLHKLFYKMIIRRALPSLEKILCISLDVEEFVKSMYGIPKNRLEFYPLGGIIYPDAEYQRLRALGRNRLGLHSNQILVLQTGKFNREKKLIESLRAFQSASVKNITLVVAGSIDEDIRLEVESLLKQQKNVLYIGWVDRNGLSELLCASDCYLQPGTQSATMQQALCARCPVILDDVKSHKPFITSNGWFVKNEADLVSVYQSIQKDPALLQKMSTQSLSIARNILDYKSLASRLYR